MAKLRDEAIAAGHADGDARQVGGRAQAHLHPVGPPRGLQGSALSEGQGNEAAAPPDQQCDAETEPADKRSDLQGVSGAEADESPQKACPPDAPGARMAAIAAAAMVAALTREQRLEKLLSSESLFEHLLAKGLCQLFLDNVETRI